MGLFEDIYNADKKTQELDMDYFIQESKGLWQDIPEPKEIKGEVLVEGLGMCYTGHSNAIAALILNRARGLSPLVLGKYVDINFYKGYVSTAKDAPKKKPSIIDKIRYSIIANNNMPKIKKKADILDFYYDGVPYGDLLYDEYIRRRGLATIHEIDSDIRKIMIEIMQMHDYIKYLIKTRNIKAMVVHQSVGLSSCVPRRVGIKFGIYTYIFAGWCYRFDKHKDYQVTPSRKFVNDILSLSDKEFNEIYEKVHEIHVGGSNMDAKLAFNDKNKFYKSKEEFCKEYGLDQNKKNVFLMLHAFNDYPHSNFDRILFDDYYDWFIETLEYAKKDDSVNWIIKQHPSERHYIANDIDYDAIFKDIPSHIKYVGFDEPFDSRSLEYTADAIITCMGSAGYDCPAMFGIPSIIAGDNHFSEYAFTTYPKTKEDYFKVLSELKDVKKLSPENQKLARAVYIFMIYCSSYISSIHPTSYKYVGDKAEVYWSLRLLVDYLKDKRDYLIPVLKEVIDAVKDPEFKELRRDCRELLNNGRKKD